MTVTIGSILRATHAAVRAHLGSFLTIAAALVVLPALAGQLLLPREAMVDPGALTPGWLGALILLNFLVLIAVLTFAAVAGEPRDASPRSFGAALAGSLMPLLKLVVAAMLLYLAFLLVALLTGMVIALFAALLFPGEDGRSAAVLVVAGILLAEGVAGLWLAARMSALPGVYLFERASVWRGLKRAWRLSRGHAGALLLLWLIFFALAFLLAAPLLAAALPAAIAARSGAAPAIVLPSWYQPYAIASIVPWLLLYVYQGASLGILYRQLVEAAPEDETTA